MGIYKKGILGAFTGKVGNIVGSSWKGIPVVRTAPIRRKWRKPTVAQKEQQARFTLLVNFLRPLSDLLSLTFVSSTLKMGGYQKAMSLNKYAITGVYPNIFINYAKVVLGKGNLAELYTPKAVSIVSGQLIFAWTDNSAHGSALGSDIVIVAIYCAVLDRWMYVEKAAIRSDRSFAMDVTVFSAKKVHAYIMTYSESRSRVSGSVYLGALDVL